MSKNLLPSLSNAIDNAMQEDNHQSKRLKHLINVKEEISPPQKAWGLKNQNGEVAILGTLGNFSLITGKAKAKKSFFINIAISCTLAKNGTLNRFISDLPPNQSKVLYFDTEQGKYHVQLAVKRICKQLDVEIPTNLSTFHLRGLNPEQRLQFIEDEIYSDDEIGFVVIDGIKDLVTSINDEGEATMIASKLLKWTEERNIHIVTVLHQNKGDNNARGHIGTELINKAETVLSVAKEESNHEISTVKPEMCRNREPETFSFQINEDGVPIEAVGFEPPLKKASRSFNPIDLEPYKKYQLLTEVFSHVKELKYGELVSQLKIACKNLYQEEIGDNKSKDLVTECKNKYWLVQSEKGKSYTLGEYQAQSV